MTDAELNELEREAEEFVASCREDGDTIQEALEKHLMACFMNWQTTSRQLEQSIAELRREREKVRVAIDEMECCYRCSRRVALDKLREDG